MATIGLDVGQLAALDQVLIGLAKADVLPGGDGDVFLDEEGTPVARREAGQIVGLRAARWESPQSVRGDAPVLVPEPDQVPAATVRSDALLLLPAAGVRIDDARQLAWERAWTAAAVGRVVRVPVPPAEAAAMRTALAAAYSTGPVVTVDTVRQPTGAGRVVLLTGLSGSGKSTIARALVEQTAARRTVTLLDGDVVRTHLSKGLGFSQADRDVNIRRIGWVAAEVAKHGGLAVCAPIAPYDETRRWVRGTVEAAAGPNSFVLVWVSTPIEVCEQRDVKGLYAKARAGELTGFTGVDDPYQPPSDAEVVIDASVVPVTEAVSQILAQLSDSS